MESARSQRQWYLADLILEITVEDDPRTLIHTNLTLVRAEDPEDAFVKATELGEAQEAVYRNPHGKLVRCRFCGIGELIVVYEELEHGAELSYSEQILDDPQDRMGWVTPKEQLAVFRKLETNPHKPDFRDAEITLEVNKIIRSRSGAPRD